MLRIYKFKIEMLYKEVIYDKWKMSIFAVLFRFGLNFYANCCFWYLLFFLGTLA